MQTYLPLIQAVLSEWYLVTLNNPLYAGVLATSVWLLTALLYSIRIGALKRATAASEKSGIENLKALQEQLQNNQEQLAAANLQMEKALSTAQEETHRALTLEQLLYQRNKQIADTLQLLATSFDLGERPLLATEDVKADLLWQQHTKVITLLVERLRTEQQAKKELQQTCQAETAKLAEKEVLLEALQSTLDSHATQLSKLERTLEEQKTILQQHDNAQQVLSDTLKNYQPAATNPAKPIHEEVKSFIPFEVNQKPVDSLFTQTAPQPPDIGTASITVQTPAVEPKPMVIEQPAQPFIKPKAPIAEAPYVSLETEQQPVTAGIGSLGKIKNLFGKKQTPVKTEPQWTETKPVEPEVSTLPTEPEQAPEKVQKAPGKLQGFYSKFKTKGK